MSNPWTTAQHRKFKATMKAKRSARKIKGNGAGNGGVHRHISARHLLAAEAGNGAGFVIPLEAVPEVRGGASSQFSETQMVDAVAILIKAIIKIR